jgi:hypothetical protein
MSTDILDADALATAEMLKMFENDNDIDNLEAIAEVTVTDDELPEHIDLMSIEIENEFPQTNNASGIEIEDEFPEVNSASIIEAEGEFPEVNSASIIEAEGEFPEVNSASIIEAEGEFPEANDTSVIEIEDEFPEVNDASVIEIEDEFPEASIAIEDAILPEENMSLTELVDMSQDDSINETVASHVSGDSSLDIIENEMAILAGSITDTEMAAPLTTSETKDIVEADKMPTISPEPNAISNHLHAVVGNAVQALQDWLALRQKSEESAPTQGLAQLDVLLDTVTQQQQHLAEQLNQAPKIDLSGIANALGVTLATPQSLGWTQDQWRSKAQDLAHKTDDIAAMNSKLRKQLEQL